MSRLIRYDETGLEGQKENMIRSGLTFVMEYKSGFRTIYRNGDTYTSQQKKSYMKALHSGRGRSVIGNVRKSVNAYIINHNFNIPPVELMHAPTSSFPDRFKAMQNGEEFFYVDIKHCYWRVAYLMGLIPKNLYVAYKDSDDHKITRNIALSTLASTRKREYYEARQPHERGYPESKLLYTIECVSDHYKQIYTNIRYTAYNLMGSIFMEVERDSLGYHIDGIFVTEESLGTVRTILKNRNYNYRTIKCSKLNNQEYLYNGDETKTFR